MKQRSAENVAVSGPSNFYLTQPHIVWGPSLSILVSGPTVKQINCNKQSQTPTGSTVRKHILKYRRWFYTVIIVASIRQLSFLKHHVLTCGESGR